MICHCGLPSAKVLATRLRPDGITLRRRQCPDGHRWTTFEMDETLVKRIGPRQINEKAAQHTRRIKVRQQAQIKREVIAHHPEMSTKDLSKLLGCSERQVQHLRCETSAP